MEHIWRLGDRGPAVAEIRATLARLGLLDSQASADPLFDQSVDRAVRAFQQGRGLTVDGVVDAATYRALDEARWRLGDRTLQLQPRTLMRGDDVAALQSRLITMGFHIGRLDGIFGVRTEAGLKEFQQSVGLPTDGVCGPETYVALTRLTKTITGGAATALREREAISSHGSSLAGRTVVIDPGHGGSDRGCVRNGLDESEVVFDLARRIEGRLAALGVAVFLTRGFDLSPDEIDRAEFANQSGADLFVSLHVDEHSSEEAHGLATYFYGHDAHGFDSPVGERFATLIQREICARTDLADCRSHAKTWELLRRTRMPAVRIDVGYLSHEGDSNRLAQSPFRDTLAEAIVVAIQRLYLPEEADAATGVLRLGDLNF
jgi:N-acetylmuramoyl-L-alanine amidase